MGASSIRVLLVDDFEPFRRLLSSRLQERPGIQVICEASDGFEAVRRAEELQPDLILLDIGLPTLNGFAAARQIRNLSPRSKILFVSSYSSAELVHEALNAGAKGYVVKTDVKAELGPAIDAVIAGNRFIGARFGGRDFTDSVDWQLAKQGEGSGG